MTPPVPASARFGCGDDITVPLHYTPHAVTIPKPGDAAIILGYAPSGRAVTLHVTSAEWLDDLEAAIRGARAAFIPSIADLAVTP